MTEKVGNGPILAYWTRMKHHPEAQQSQRKQMLRSRVFWFLAGSVVNYLLIVTPFNYLEAHTHLSDWEKAACSMGVSATFFFCWNYFINFRTDSRKRDALARYLGAVVLMWLLSSTTLGILKQFDARMAFSLGKFKLDLDVIATQFFLAGLKFFLYHRWVFPLGKDTPPKTPSRPVTAEIEVS